MICEVAWGQNMDADLQELRGGGEKGNESPGERGETRNNSDNTRGQGGVSTGNLAEGRRGGSRTRN